MACDQRVTPAKGQRRRCRAAGVLRPCGHRVCEQHLPKHATCPGAKPRTIVPAGPLTTTNPAGAAHVESAAAFGPGGDVEPLGLQTLDVVRKSLYGAVAALRTATRSVDDDRFHLLVPMLAIAATEADAIVTLASYDLHRPCDIHVRALGQIAKRTFFLADHKRADLCRQLRASLDTSRKKHSAKLHIPDELREIDEALYSDADGKTFQTLESTLDAAIAEDAKTNPNAGLTTSEHAILSKWTHADIIAIVVAANILKKGSPDVRGSFNDRGRMTMLVGRSITFGIMLLCVANELGVNVSSALADIKGRMNKVNAAANQIAAHMDADVGATVRGYKANLGTLRPTKSQPRKV